MPPKYARLAGLGAFGASAGLLALLALVMFVSMPRPGGGIDWVNGAVAWISLATMFAALIAIHVVLGRKLLELGRGEHAREL